MTDVMHSIKKTTPEELKRLGRSDLQQIFKRTRPQSKKFIAAMVTAQRRQQFE